MYLLPPNLEVLIACNGQIKYLKTKSSFFRIFQNNNLPPLKCLYLSGNQIEDIKSVSKFRNLRWLNMNSNKIKRHFITKNT